jgi:uncharacterized protein (DUF433 family)
MVSYRFLCEAEHGLGGEALLAGERMAAHAGGVMKTRADGPRDRVKPGRHIVADPEIWGGQPMFKSARSMVWVILEQLEAGMTRDDIVAEWPEMVSKAAIAKAIATSDLANHEPFLGFEPGMQPKPFLPAEEHAAV